MKKYKGYLIDLDGTVYRGEEIIREAVDFVNKLQNLGIPYLFVTNNSARTREQVAEKLNNMGMPTTADHVLTSGVAAANKITKERPEARVLLIGEEGLYRAMKAQSIPIVDKEPNTVVIGIDRNITYEKLAK